MAEIGIIASVIGIVGAGTKLSIAIFDFASNIGSAGKELQHVATEVSDLCSVLKQLQTLLEHAHFRPSKTAVEAAQRIINQCSRVFSEIDEIITELRGKQGDDIFPSPDFDFVAKVKWTFSKKSKVLLLRSTLDACKSTLSVMLITMLLAEKVSQRRDSTDRTFVEEEQDKAMTQSLVIAQQCAVEQLEFYEDEVEKEEDAAMQLPGLSHAGTRPNDQKRRKSRGRLVKMFSGLSVVTELPTPEPLQQRPPTRAERASIWLDNILAPPNESLDPHPGKHRPKRLSSFGTVNAPSQLLRKWTDQADHLDEKVKCAAAVVAPAVHELWRDSEFSFSGSKSPSQDRVHEMLDEEAPSPGIKKIPTDLVSPKTARVQSIGFHVVVGVDGALESSTTELHAHYDSNDSYQAIARAIMQEHGATANVDDISLCIAYGGKVKVLKHTDKPLEALRHYEELELDPRLFLRRTHTRPP